MLIDLKEKSDKFLEIIEYLKKFKKSMEHVQILYKNKRTYEWLIIAQSYFQVALIGARILQEKINGYTETKNLKKIWGNYSQSPRYLFFPLVFNFKHGIEIYLKSIIGMSNKEFPKSHDLMYLFSKASITDESIRGVVEKYAYSRLLLPSNKKTTKKISLNDTHKEVLTTIC
jgi:hypothetical protein